MSKALQKTDYTASNRIIHLWALGGMTNYWMSAVIYSFLSIVFITSYEMNPAWVATAMMVPRLVDIVIDPLLGRISDNTHSRWGRRRPFIFVSTILGAFLVMTVWWIPLGWIDNWKGFAYLLFFTTLLYANLGAFEMSHNAFGYELSDDYNRRSTVQAARNLYFTLGALGGGFTYWMAQRPIFGSGHHGEVNGFRWISIVMAGIILGSGLISVFTIEERFSEINRSHVKLWQALKATLANRPFFVILALRFINVLGMTLWGAMMPYIGIYSMCDGNKELFNQVVAGWSSVASVLLGFALVPLAAPITRRLDKRHGLMICYGLACVSALLTPLIMRPGHVYLYFVLTLIFLPALTLQNNLLASVMPDICDMDELEHGERREGLFTAVLSFVSKLESSLCIGFGGALLILSGFNQHLLQQPQPVLDKMRFYGFTPLIVGAFLTFVVACFFPLTRRKMDEIRAKLDARHAEAHIPGAEANASEETTEISGTTTPLKCNGE